LLSRFQNRFLTLTQYVFKSRNNAKYRFRFARWFLRLFHVRFTEQLLAAVVQLQLAALAASNCG